jgi:hypothetical protein
VSRERLLYHPLGAGWAALDREDLPDGSLLHFLAELEIDEPVDAAFEQVVLGMTDSGRSWLWPTEYEWSPERPVGGVREGAAIKMMYQVPRFDRPDVAAVPTTYLYRLARYRPREHLLEYTTLEHPLSGGATIKVDAVHATRSRISWVGYYRIDPAQDIVVKSMLKFLPLVFVTMDRHAQERRQRAKA